MTFNVTIFYQLIFLYMIIFALSHGKVARSETGLPEVGFILLLEVPLNRIITNMDFGHGA